MPASEYTINYVIDGLATRQEPKDHEDIDYFIHYLKQVADLDPEPDTALILHRYVWRSAPARLRPLLARFPSRLLVARLAIEVHLVGRSAGQTLMWAEVIVMLDNQACLLAHPGQPERDCD